MSGPGVSILLPQPFSSLETELIEQTILLISGELSATDEIPVITTLNVGGSFAAERRTEARPFGMSGSVLSADERDASAAIAQHFGVRHQSQIDVYAFCNARVDHQILGEIALYVALQTPRSLISFGGDLSSYEQIGGRLLSVPYETAWGTNAVSSYGDVEFLRFWLLHPSFFMVK